MKQVYLKITRGQGQAMERALGVLAMLCRRKLVVLVDLVSAGLIPVFDGNSLGRKAGDGERDEIALIVKTLQGVVGVPAEDADGAGGTQLERGATAALGKVEEALRSAPGDVLGIRLSLEEAGCAAEAMDVLARLAIGQVEIVEEMFRFGKVLVADMGGVVRHGEVKELDRCGAMITRLKGALNFQRGQSLGIGNRSVSIEAHRAWEVCKAIKRELAVHRNPHPSFRSVDYDGNMLRYTSDPAPDVVVCEAGTVPRPRLKIAGAEFKRFWKDRRVWVKGAVLHEGVFRLNGRDWEGVDVDPLGLQSTDELEIISGTLVGGQEGVPASLEEAFLWWRSRSDGGMAVDAGGVSGGGRQVH